MAEIALTRRMVAGDDSLRRAAALVGRVDLAARVRRPPLVVILLVTVAAATVVRDLDLPARLAVAAGLGLVAGLAVVALQTALTVVQFRRSATADLAPGAVVEVGVAPGVIRLRGPDDDGITRADRIWLVQSDDQLLLLGALRTVIPRDLLTDDDLRQLHEPGPPALPDRPARDVALTRQFFVDERWPRRFGRAEVARAHRSPPWWVSVLLVPVAVASVAQTRGPGLHELRVAVVVIVLTIVVFGLLTWTTYRSAARSAAIPPEGELWSVGLDSAAVRLVRPHCDVLTQLATVRRVVLLRDVLRFDLAGGGFLRLPRELVSDADLARVREVVAARAGRR